MAAQNAHDTGLADVVARELELRQRQRLLEAASAAARIGFFHWTPETNGLSASPELLELFGFAPDEVIDSTSTFGRVHPDDLERVHAALEAARTGDFEYYAEFRVIWPSGEVRWLAGRGRWIEGPHGSLVLVGANWDITATRAAADRTRGILDGLGALAGLMELDGTLVEANSVALELGGLTSEDVLGKPFWDAPWWSYDPAVQETLKDAVARAREGEIVRYDARVRGAEGALFDIDFTLSPLHDENGRITHLIPSAFDITGRKQAEEQVRLVNRELQHRIANVFTVVSSLLRLSAQYGRDIDSFVAATTDRLRALEAAHRDTGGALGVQPANLSVLARQVLRPWREIPGARLGIAGPELPLSRGQATALGLIFHELATNAAKYGSLASTQGTVRLTWSRDDDGFHVEWRERGAGAVSAPTKKGFGLTVIETLAQNYLDGDAVFDFDPEGLSVRVHARG